MTDLAHIAHAELLTPTPEESLRFFHDVLGMEVEHQEGQSVFLRGWGEYLRYGLKLTEAAKPGLGHMARRAWSPEGVRRVADKVQGEWVEDYGHGPAYSFGGPSGHRIEV